MGLSRRKQFVDFYNAYMDGDASCVETVGKGRNWRLLSKTLAILRFGFWFSFLRNDLIFFHHSYNCFANVFNFYRLFFRQGFARFSRLIFFSFICPLGEIGKESRKIVPVSRNPRKQVLKEKSESWAGDYWKKCCERRNRFPTPFLSAERKRSRLKRDKHFFHCLKLIKYAKQSLQWDSCLLEAQRSSNKSF